MRLIDADMLEKNIANHKVYDSFRALNTELRFVFETTKGDMFKKVIEAPAIDAVPVVRCKDCELGVDTKYGLVCDHTDRSVPADGFCHAGKRRVIKNEND